MLARSIRRFALCLSVCFALLPASDCLLAQDSFTNWPTGYTPQEVGQRLSDHFLETGHHQPKLIAYPEVCTWYGALQFAKLTHDDALLAKLRARFEPLLTGSETSLVPAQGTHVDLSMFGSLPLELYMQTKDPRYLALGKSFADKQWDNPDTAGLTKETRFWVDDMYMITIVQVQAYRATGDRKYLDRAALEAATYLDKLQQPNGLFYHAPDVPFFWSRGNGWFAAGMTELLRELPKDHPKRARIERGYHTMMAALLKYQGKDGMWKQLLDHEEAWPESSGTGMFTYAMVAGVKNGWLDEKLYGPAARHAWLALVGYVDQNANVTSVCEGTNKLNDLDYYLLRKRRTGDFHGQAAALWATDALLR